MPHIVFHSRDFDGVASAAVAVQHFGYDNCKLYPWDYGQEEPEIPEDGDPIYIIDISPDRLLKSGRDVFWIDHHISAIRKYGRGIPGLQIDGVAACRLTWLFLHAPHHSKIMQDGDSKQEVELCLSRLNEPRVIEMVGRFDVWELSTKVLDFQYGLISYKMLAWDRKTLDRWINLMEDPMMAKDVEDRGQWGRACYDEQAKVTCKLKAYELEFEGLKFLAMNSCDPSSRAFNTPKIDQYDGLLKWHFTPEGRISISLYRPQADDKLDLSVIAQKFGGGGHRGACGFTLPASDYKLLLPSGA